MRGKDKTTIKNMPPKDTNAMNKGESDGGSSSVFKPTISNFDAQQTLNTINFWIENCDIKTSSILGIIGVVLSIAFASGTYDIIKIKLKKFFSSWADFGILRNVIVAFSILFFIMGIILLIYTLSPKIIKDKKRKKKSEIVSLTFYESVAQYDYIEYKKMIFQKMKKDDFFQNDLIWQIHSASKICSRKFHCFKLGLWFSILGLLVFSALVICF